MAISQIGETERRPRTHGGYSNWDQLVPAGHLVPRTHGDYWGRLSSDFGLMMPPLPTRQLVRIRTNWDYYRSTDFRGSE